MTVTREPASFLHTSQNGNMSQGPSERDVLPLRLTECMLKDPAEHSQIVQC